MSGIDDLENWLPHPGETKPARQFHKVSASQKTTRTTRIHIDGPHGCGLSIDIEHTSQDGAIVDNALRYWVDGHLVPANVFRDALAMLSTDRARIYRTENGAMR